MPKALTKEEFINKANRKYNFKYDYSKVNFVDRNTKVTIICPEHGEFEASPCQHLAIKNKTGCPKCGAILSASHTKFTTEDFIRKAKAFHGDKYDYSKSVYTKAKEEITIICPEHGEFEQTAYGHMHGDGCPKCKGQLRIKNKKMTKEEFLEKAKAKYGDIYDYSMVNYIDGTTPIKIHCLKHDYTFEKSPSKFLKGETCPHCGKERQAQTFKYTREQFIQKAIKIHGNRYDYSKVVYEGCDKPVIIICPIHGEFTQTPGCHLMGEGCNLCNGNLPLTNEEFEKKGQEINGNKYDYSQVNYINSHTPVKIFCKKHQTYFEQMPYKHLLEKQGCPICSDSKLEESVHNLLTDLNINFNRQQMFDDLGLLKYDFYLPEHKILIECQGEQHITEMPFFHKEKGSFQSQLDRDFKKYNYAIKNGYVIIYFFRQTKISLHKPEFNGIYENQNLVFKDINKMKKWLNNIKNY